MATPLKYLYWGKKVAKNRNRDEFLPVTREILAKRVGYVCSNPDCQAFTVGPNEELEKSTSLGEAAHITAAAEGGPRYDEAMAPGARQSIENAIWLCKRCARLIDLNPKIYTVPLLQEWKHGAEERMWYNITKGKSAAAPWPVVKNKEPFIEVDLVWSHGGRFNGGLSLKNKIEVLDGKPVMIIDNSTPPIIFWELGWTYALTLYNNAEVPAYNIKVEEVGGNRFARLTESKRINNLPPLGNLQLQANLERTLEGIWTEADERIKIHYPVDLEGMELKITYRDEWHVNHEARAAYTSGTFTTVKVC